MIEKMLTAVSSAASYGVLLGEILDEKGNAHPPESPEKPFRQKNKV